MSFKSVFVTVGTTKFDNLIRAIMCNETLEILKRKGCTKLKLQIGNGEYVPECNKQSELIIEYYKFKSSILDDIEEADLVISHAGAGTCLEVLELNKNLVAVINEDLMDNHQVELAEKLMQNGHIFSCTCGTLNEVLKYSDFNQLQLFPNEFPKKCARFIECFLQVDEEK